MALIEDDSKCPKPDIRCSEDGTECAVGCPAYDKSFTECKETSDCAQNRVCCQDPCPNSPLKLCFPDNEKVSRQKTAISKPAIQPPPQSTVMVDEEVKADRKKKLQNLVCPIGDLSSCIGWVAEPGKNGTGTCVSQKDCAEDRVCCKITECFDGLKHCVKQIKESALRKGCPTPSYFKFSPSKEQKLIKCAGDKDCTGNRLCCQLDVYGTKGCTPSSIN
ncbi:hypothetical protein EB796_016664 [Bugula neritina]|uniref:Uncharacterized protein n=1 Tax=Bugula neritina TaxID=10212 RepID=A0A7J7JG86_BUGNE|nr:hypothetical protein EB796_016664 [Bugula neritina]